MDNAFEESMSARRFLLSASAPTAEEAFQKLQQEALGGRGSTPGTIGCKSAFILVETLAGESADDCIARCQKDGTHFSNSKYSEYAAAVNGGPDLRKP